MQNSPYTNKECSLRVAANVGDLSEVKKLLTAGADINAAGAQSGKTALHRAAEHGHNNIIDELLWQGAKIDQQDRDGNTPLHLACINKKFSTISLLTKEYADPHIINDKNQIPGEMLGFDRDGIALKNYTTKMGDKEGVTLIGSVDTSGRTPPKIIKIIRKSIPSKERLTKLKDLLQKRQWNEAKQQLKTEDPTILHYIVRSKITSPTFNTIIDGNYDLAFRQAASLGKKEILLKLLPLINNINGCGKSRRTALHNAAIKNHPKIISILLKNGADINSLDVNHKTPLHFACRCKSYKSLIVLYNKGAELPTNKQNKLLDELQNDPVGKYIILGFKLKTKTGTNFSLISRDNKFLFLFYRIENIIKAKADQIYEQIRHPKLIVNQYENGYTVLFPADEKLEECLNAFAKQQEHVLPILS